LERRPLPARIYLDHAATTPMLPAAKTAMADALDRWANPSSPHAEGRAARGLLEEARRRIKAALGWSHELIFTSGATEAIAIVMQRAKAERLFISAVEHDAFRRTGVATETLPVDGHGIVTLTDAPITGALVAVQSVNNETGVIQPLDLVANIMRAERGLFLADCAQSAGKLPLPDADFIAISAHKLGGPPGIGALLLRDLRTIEPSGGQEGGYRAGTENLPAIPGFAAALEAQRNWVQRAAELRMHLETKIEAEGGIVIARGAHRLPTIGSYRMPGVPASSQLIQFDLAGVAVSAGSACSSGSLRPSHVLEAMGWDEAAAREVVRVSFGTDTSRADIYRFVEVWTRMAADARARV
jgi:cysteine desulfurase